MESTRPFLLRTLSALTLLVGMSTAATGQTAVDLELVLAVDVSLSMDFDEQKLQRDGYAAAFRHPDVVAAIRAGGTGRIAVTYVEWAGVGQHRTVVPWTVIDGLQSAATFADRIEDEPILPNRRTSISSALDFAAGLFASSGVQGVRRVVDVSGDGANNQGDLVEYARDRVVAQNITINGLPILLKSANASGFFDSKDLDIYYEDCVIGGFGAFLVPVREASEFPAAIRRKLILEISSAVPQLVPVQFAVERPPRVDCLMGERQWQLWMLDDPN